MIQFRIWRRYSRDAYACRSTLIIINLFLLYVNDGVERSVLIHPEIVRTGSKAKFQTFYHVTSICSNNLFWSTFQLIEVDHIVSWSYMIIKYFKCRFWSSSNNLKLDQKQVFEQIEVTWLFISKSNYGGSKAIQ